jgi:hypothetical protein
MVGQPAGQLCIIFSHAAGAPVQLSYQQPSNVRSVYLCFCELSELVQETLYLMHAPTQPLTSTRPLTLYTKYLNWYDQVPRVLRLGSNFTPSVLFVQ